MEHTPYLLQDFLRDVEYIPQPFENIAGVVEDTPQILQYFELIHLRVGELVQVPAKYLQRNFGGLEENIKKIKEILNMNLNINLMTMLKLIKNELINDGHMFTMILTTHSMEKAEILCDSVGWLDKGNFICIGNIGIIEITK